MRVATRTRSAAQGIWSGHFRLHVSRSLVFLITGGLLVAVTIVPIAYAQPSEAAIWLLLLWFAWAFSTLWILAVRPFSPPAFGLMIIMLLYILIPATGAVVTGKAVIAGVDYSRGTLAALQLSVAAQIALGAGVIIVHHARGGTTTGIRRVVIKVSRRRLNQSAVIALAIAAAALLLLAGTSGADLSRYAAVLGRTTGDTFYSTASGTTSGYLGSLTDIAGVSILVAVCAGSLGRRGKPPVLLILLSLIATAFLVAGGERVRFVVPALAAGILWIKIRGGRRPLALRTLTLLAVGGLVIFSAVVGVARGQGTRSFTVANLFTSQFVQGSDLFSPLAGLTQTVPAQHDYLWGSSYLEALYFPIPRAVWPAKPQGAILDVTAGFANVSNGESFPEYGEMYANFGLPGVILGCLTFAAFLEWLWIRFAESAARSRLFVYPVLIAVMLQIFTRDYAVSQLAGLLGFILGALVLQRVLGFQVLSREPFAVQSEAGIAFVEQLHIDSSY
jgi:oligosaccharide repeat unit polymerase